MFKNLNSQKKFMFVALGIVSLVFLILAIYFVLYKKSPAYVVSPKPLESPTIAPKFLSWGYNC